MSSIDNHGIPVVHSSEKTAEKKNLRMEDEKRKLHQSQNPRRQEYFRTSSPQVPSSPRFDSGQQHCTTEPIFTTPYISPVRSTSLTSNVYVKSNASLIRKPKRKSDELDITYSSHAKLTRLSHSNNKSPVTNTATSKPTRADIAISPMKVDTSPLNHQVSNSFITRQTMFPYSPPVTQENRYPVTPDSLNKQRVSIYSLTEQRENLNTPISSLPQQKEMLSTPLKQNIAATTFIQQQKYNRENEREELEAMEDTTKKSEDKENKVTEDNKDNKVKDKMENEAEKKSNKLPSKDEGARAAEEAAEAAEAAEISELMNTVKCLPDYYKLMSKIGEGTFSTVYKALDIRRDYYYNQDWELPLLKQEGEEKPSKTLSQFVALKRIYDTSSPRRIANEIFILRKLKGSPCISPLITAFRQQDQVFVVMPYLPNDDFKTTFSDMSMIEIKSYLKCLFTALRELHKHNIIHRDIKPNNFLYNRKKKTGYLIDFGLAEHENEGKKLEEYDSRLETRAQNDMYIQSSRNAAINRTPLKPSGNNSTVLASLSNKENRASDSPVPSFVLPTATSTEEPKVMGYVKNDARHHAKANRAGTRGFRAPEILMKVTRQKCAIDIWAAGIILACFMTGRYPFFLANEESDAIIELAQVYGSREMEKCATRNNRIFSTNINIPLLKVPWSKLAEHLNKETIEKWDQKDYKDGLDLLERTLDLNSDTRITAARALEHPFLR